MLAEEAAGNLFGALWSRKIKPPDKGGFVDGNTRALFFVSHDLPILISNDCGLRIAIDAACIDSDLAAQSLQIFYRVERALDASP